jgi:outer membrane usher protein
VASNDEGFLSGSYQGQAGRATLAYSRQDGESGLQAELSGGVAITSEGFMASRRLDQSFAIVKVADYADLTVYVDNQPVARTDATGRVLLDALRPYDTNLVSIDPTELPMDASLQKASMTVVPAHRSGAVVKFPVSRVRSATLRLALPGGEAVPAGARVTLDGHAYPVALSGMVYIDNLPEARQGTAQWVDKTCAFSLPELSQVDAIADLGTIRCEPTAH